MGVVTASRSLADLEPDPMDRHGIQRYPRHAHNCRRIQRLHAGRVHSHDAGHPVPDAVRQGADRRSPCDSRTRPHRTLTGAIMTTIASFSEATSREIEAENAARSNVPEPDDSPLVVDGMP